ncbi:MAG: 30S ribosomal protein S17 [Chitinispirillaceae bacterium]|nr:30S ribosomal protein S17 [Chitinispirillaceae bacterium]
MSERGQRKERIGTVVSDKMDKTVIVSVERRFIHPAYGRIVRKNSTYVAHDAKDECKTGDRVKIYETRPLSKTKRWRVGEILERAK